MQETHSAAAVANTFLELARREGHSLTNMQVQKLAFMSHGVHLAAFDGPLIHECPRAWTFGPVIPTLYESLRRFGSNTVTGTLEASDQVVANSSAEKAICHLGCLQRVDGRSAVKAVARQGRALGQGLECA